MGVTKHEMQRKAPLEKDQRHKLGLRQMMIHLEEVQWIQHLVVEVQVAAPEEEPLLVPLPHITETKRCLSTHRSS